MAASRFSKQRVVMTFSFTNIMRAHELADKLKALGLPSTIEMISGEPTRWFVTTNTSCLDHAAELSKFIGGAN
jgi:hypothetical protein